MRIPSRPLRASLALPLLLSLFHPLPLGAVEGAPEIDWDWPAEVSVDAARVHSEPNLESKTVARFKLGARVRVRWVDSEWLELVDTAFRDRFMSKKVLQVLARDPSYEASPEAEALRLVVKVKGTDVNLRKEEGEGKRPVIAKLGADTETLEVRRKDRDWAIVLKPEKWAGSLVSTQYLEIVAKPSAQ